MNQSFLKVTCMALAFAAGAHAQTGKWIWQSAAGQANDWICFRKTLSLTSVPSSAVIGIAVDTKYWLWVNGTMAVFEGGLKRGPNPNDTYYDEVDIKQYLTTGANTIAVLVWFFGKEGFSHKNSGQGGLWIESASSGFTLATDATWKVKQHPAYGTAGGQPNYRLAESSISFDARNDIPGWMNSGFSDAAWSAATEKGTPPCAPWNALVPRPIPQWKDYGLKNYTNTSSIPATATGGIIAAKLPYNAQVTVYLKINAPSAGQSIDIRTDDYSGGGEDNVMATYITKAGAQEYESFGWMNGHEVQYTIPSGITITSLQYRETGYNCGFVPTFTGSDTAINSYCTKAQRTVYVNMRDNYMDCPDRERAQWIADVALDIGIAGYAFDTSAYALAHKAYSNLVQWHKSTGELFAPVPAGNWESELPMQIMNSTGWYGVWRYYMDSRDKALLQEMYPIVSSYLLTKYTLTGGLVDHRAGDWDWEDWGSNADAPVLDNSWYYLALKGLKAMAGVLGITTDLAAINERMTSIETKFDTTFWNGSAYVGDVKDDRANAMAVVSGLAPSSRYAAVRTVLTSVKQASPFMEKFVLEALCKMGYVDDAVTRLKQRFGTMISNPLTTLWEGWTHGGANSYNHGWAGGGIVVMAECVAGIAPDSAGYDVFHVLPSMGTTLTTVNQAVETRHGRINAGLARQADGFTMQVNVPAGTWATLGVPTTFSNGVAVASVKANNTTVWPSGTLTGITFDATDTRFIRFKAQPGTWTLTAGSGPPVSGSRCAPAKNAATIDVTIRVAAGSMRVQVPRWIADRQDALRVTIYSITGRSVRSIDARAGSAGNLVADAGASLIPGRYLVRVRASGFDTTVPAVLVR